MQAEVAAELQTLAANKQAIMQHVALLTQQMAALLHNPGTAVRPPHAGNNFVVPTLPTYIGYQGGGGYNGAQGSSSYGRGGGRGEGVAADLMGANVGPVDRDEGVLLLRTTSLMNEKPRVRSIRPHRGPFNQT